MIGYTVFFGGYFYVLFSNLVCSFSLAVENRVDAAMALFVSTAVAIILPATICWQHHYIVELERKIDNYNTNACLGLKRQEK